MQKPRNFISCTQLFCFCWHEFSFPFITQWLKELSHLYGAPSLQREINSHKSDLLLSFCSTICMWLHSSINNYIISYTSYIYTVCTFPIFLKYHHLFLYTWRPNLLFIIYTWCKVGQYPRGNRDGQCYLTWDKKIKKSNFQYLPYKFSQVTIVSNWKPNKTFPATILFNWCV